MFCWGSASERLLKVILLNNEEKGVFMKQLFEEVLKENKDEGRWPIYVDTHSETEFFEAYERITDELANLLEIKEVEIFKDSLFEFINSYREDDED